jgi:glycosyltransferase 2 family protein
MDQSDALDQPTPSKCRPAMRRLGPALGYLLAAVGLVWILYDIRLEKLLGHLTKINWWWVALAIVSDILSYTCQGLRWKLLLRPVVRISTLRSTQAIYTGLLTNEVLPMRLGELVRGYLVSRWAAAQFITVIPSMVVERLFDGVWLALGVGLMATFVPLPRKLLKAGDVLGVLVVIATGLFLYFVFHPHLAAKKRAEKGAWSWGPLRTAASLFDRLTGGLRDIGFTRSFYLAFILSPAHLFLQVLAFWLVMVSYGLRLSFWVGMAVYLIVYLGTLIPNAPANVGAYQFFCIVGLMLFGVEKTTATGFSLVVFVLLTLPLLIIGLIALSRSGTTLLNIREEVRRLMAYGPR